ncbi:MAG: GTP-binding protein [Bacillota bacterium]
MSVCSAEFIISAANAKQYPNEGLPEVVLVGRSNVGKSSFINTFVGRKRLAKTSSTPGKTQLFNFYLINKQFYFVDLPGYGFAKVPAGVREKWDQMFASYFIGRNQIKLLLHLLDIRHLPSVLDHKMRAFYQHYDLPVLIVLTKSDKLTRSQVAKQIKNLRAALKVSKTEKIYLFSTKEKMCYDDLWQILLRKTAKD